MARAKRTDRAEARRRHRAAQGFTDAELDAAEAEDDANAARPIARGDRAPRAAADSAPPQRIGIGNAFRLAFRPLDLRGDLAAFPRIALRSRALWVPLGLTFASAALVAIVGVSRSDLLSVLTNFVFQYFVFTPAIGGVFIAGFLAPRASWLFGIVVGLAAAACFAILIVAFPTQIYAVPPNEAEASAAASGAFFLSPVMGALFASMAAWYRRFLALSSPNRNRRAAANTGRRDGKSRAASARR